MRFISHLILLILIMGFFPVKAQVPGYMGRTFELSYSGQIFPSLQNLDNGDFPMFLIHSFRLEKTVERHGSLSFSYNMFTTNVNLGEVYFEGDSIDQYGSPYTVTPVQKDKIFKLQAKVFGLHYVVYKRGWLSPVGDYLSFGLLYLNAQSPDYLIYTPGIENQVSNKKFSRVYLSFSFGKKWMMSNRLSFRMAVNSAFSFSTDLFGSDSYSRDPDIYFQNIVKKRVRKMLLLNLEMGAGFLLF